MDIERNGSPGAPTFPTSSASRTDGWALVGDAGVHKDPFLALGICDAFRDAELLTTALDACFTYRRPLYGGLSEYVSRRNEATTPDFHENLAAARFLPLPEEVYRRRESRAPHGGGTSDGLIAPR